MFKDFFLFEIRYRLRQPMIYIFFLISFLLVFAATISDTVQLGDSHDGLNVNAPHVILSMTLLITLIGVFMTTAFMNTAILRDFDYQYDGILFATPISKFGYLGGRFAGAAVLALVPFLGVFAGIFLGSISPWVEASRVGPFIGQAYWNAFWLAVVPNTLLISSIVFMLAALFRSSLFSFIGAMGVIIVYVMMISFTSNLDNEMLAIIMDPLAINSYSVITKYWTVYDKNNLPLGFSWPILLNRLLWTSASLGFLALTYYRFSFARKKSIFQRKEKKSETTSKPLISIPNQLKALPQVSTHQDWAAQSQQLWHQIKMEFWGMVKSTPFIILLLFGMFNMLVSIPRVSEYYGTGNHPVTYLMVDAIRGSLYLFLIGIILYYSGVIVWRERDAKMNAFFDASPFPSWLPFTSKMLALFGTLFLILGMSIFCGVAVQAVKGYYVFEWGVYVREFLVYDFLGFCTLIVLSMVVQTLVNHKYLGYFTFILLLILLRFGPTALEIQSHLFIYASTPNHIYSDMNAWSAYAAGLAWFKVYWVFFASILALIGMLFWVRGQSLTWPQRWQIARLRFQGPMVGLATALVFLWLGTGSFLWYQTKVVNQISASQAMEQQQADYEVKYQQYQHLAQPRITSIDYDIDLYPVQRHFLVQAAIVAQNKTHESITNIHFTLPNIVQSEVQLPAAQLLTNDTSLNYQIYRLDEPLQPGDSLQFQILTRYSAQGIENEVSNTDIIDNGSFLSNYKLLPTIGYSPGAELSDPKKRSEYDLPYRPRQATLHENCSHSCQNTYISSDADWVRVRSNISTAADQIAIAPGTLMKSWEEGGRRHFEYELKKPVLNFYSFISGRYEVARKTWQSPQGQEVDMEIYYHPGHEYNVDKMLASIQRSLTYYSRHFLPYPHEQARIIEFPRYASFAQAFPGTMPYSESIGFIANLNEENAIDMVYYVVAHEMAHQWWAHQVIGADVQGATMLSETFSQYGALMVMQEAYGKDKMKQFMRYEMDKYLRSRGRETERELPLMYNEGQGYIHYRKGSVVMYALQDYIGEDSLNLALRRYAEAVAYQEPPYTNTLEVMDYLRAVTPDSLQYLLQDMFEDIILYSNQTNKASVRTLANGKYEVKIDVSIEKFRADSLGQETLIPHHDYIDIGIYPKEKTEGERYARPLLLERHQLQGRDTSFTFIVDERPHQAGIDPNYLLIDRFPEDNVKVLDWLD